MGVTFQHNRIRILHIWEVHYHEIEYITAFGHVASDHAGQWGAGAVRDDLMITGKDWDAELGLYYFNARWYDPELGRFISPTPLAPWVEEAYVYCNNNPIMYVDCNGLQFGGFTYGYPDWQDPMSLYI